MRSRKISKESYINRSSPLPSHEYYNRILSKKPSFYALSTIIVCTVITFAILLISNKTGESLNVHFGYHFSLESNLPLNDFSPLLDIDSPVLQNPFVPNCQIGNQEIKPIRTYRTPQSHPLPAVGLVDLFDQNECSTYEDRYYPYLNENIGMTYLNRYSPSSFSNLSGWEEVELRKEALTKAMIKANINAEKESQFIDWKDMIEGCYGKDIKAKHALIIRTYENYTWGHDDILNVRALIAELALNPKLQERYDVHLLLDVHQNNATFIMSPKQRLRILQSSIPKEFWSLTTLWSEDEMAWLYPGLPGKLLHNTKPTNSYRSCFMPMQVFSNRHPEYDFLWNWEMDTRSTQDYSIILERLTKFAKHAPLDPLLENQSDWRIPATSSQRLINDEMSASDNFVDLITLNPFFNVTDSGYYWAYDFQNFPKETKRKASIGKNIRFSKRLLATMNDANADEKISAHCENFAATILVKNSESQSLLDQQPPWKGVYVPHPIFTRHNWSNDELKKAVNRNDIYKKVNEKNLRDFSFYYDGAHAKDIYDVWRNNSRVCRTPSLLHPIKGQP